MGSEEEYSLMEIVIAFLLVLIAPMFVIGVFYPIIYYVAALIFGCIFLFIWVVCLIFYWRDIITAWNRRENE